jgi:N-acetylneuraminic acid mutarotase
MVIWGGHAPTNTYLSDGAIYDPTTDRWTPISAESCLGGGELASAVWTGSSVVVWGGFDGRTYVNDGASYDPAADTWSCISTPPIVGHVGESALWADTQMVIWGGTNSAGTPLADGARYDPVGDTWTPIPPDSAPVARGHHAAAWTGTSMLIWGGLSYPNVLSDGGSYSLIGAASQSDGK